MCNRDKTLLDKSRKGVGEQQSRELNRKLKPGMLTYLNDGTEINPQIVSLQDNTRKRVDENDIAEAIRTISLGTGIPVGELVLDINRRRINQVSQAIKNLAETVKDATKSLQESFSHINESDGYEVHSGNDMGKSAEYIVTKDMAERLKAQIMKPVKVYISNKPIAVDPCSDKIFREKKIYLDNCVNGKESYTATIEIQNTTELERFKQNIVDSQILVIRRNYYGLERYESQHEIVNRNRHTSRHIPFYFKIFGQTRFVLRKSGGKGHTKFNRNVRPKGTHSHFKFYR